MATFSYSRNEENFYGHFESEEAAMTEFFSKNEDDYYVWIGENIKHTAHDFVNAEAIIDIIQQTACDECGEISENWLDGLGKNKEKLAELDKLIGDWIEANEPVEFEFFTVKNIKRVVRQLDKNQ